MSGQYPPGTVLTDGDDGARFLCVDAIPSQSSLYTPGPCVVDTEGNGWRMATIEDARPLLVLDPEDRSALNEIVQRMQVHTPGSLITPTTDRLQAALRSLLPSAKPEEPKGDGAVVVDAEGMRWVRNPDDYVGCKWRNSDRGWRPWDDIGAVRVLSEGIGEAE